MNLILYRVHSFFICLYSFVICEFNYSSNENYRTALELASSIAKGLAEVQSGKGFQAVSGTFHIEKLNMEWANPIQVITEEKARKAENVVKDGEACERPELESEENNFDGKQLARDVTGEMTGEYDVRRVLEGIDPSNGEKLSTWNRFVAGGMVVAGVTPVGKLVKLGKAAKMTSEAVEAANSVKKVSKEVGNGVTKDTVKTIDNLPRIKEVEVNFKRNLKHDAVEFERQLKDQEEGLNSLTVNRFLENRDRYLTDGRALEGNAAQKLARQEALKERVLELRKQRLTREEAKKQADEWLKTQAALHNPDQIASGNPNHIGRMGDKRINSSIGSQWKSRIKELSENIEVNSDKMTQKEKESTFLNVKLKH